MRRLRLAKDCAPLEPRDRTELPWIGSGRYLSAPNLLLDTTVYIDQLQGKLPAALELSLVSGRLWHSTVTECELLVLVGLLDPNHPDTAEAVDRISVSIDERPAHRVMNPDREVWREAGVVAGTLARRQHYGKAEHRRALNDTLIFLSGAKVGLAVLTRNVRDYDFLMQLVPEGKAIFYEV